MRKFTFRTSVKGDPYGIDGVMLKGDNGYPIVYLSDVTYRFALYPIDYVSAVVPMKEFMERYCNANALTAEEAKEELYDDAFLEACLEEGEDEYESIQMRETRF